MKKLQWWFRIVGGFYFLLGVGWSPLIGMNTLARQMFPNYDAPIGGVADKWLFNIGAMLGFEWIVMGAYMIYASREPSKHPGDMRAQITLALDNLETLLRESGFAFKDIVRLNIFTTDVDKFLENYDAFITRLVEAGCRHTGCLIGVARLAFPEMMSEVEATAVT